MSNRDEEIKAYFDKLDRGFFMKAYKEFAHIDQALPIGYDQTISQPSLVLQMTLALDLPKSGKVLEIGTGSGFQTALLAAFSKSVYTIERIGELYTRSKKRLEDYGCTNIFHKYDDGSEGWPEQAPFDRIMVTAAASEIPHEYVKQLTAGGKMVIPVGNHIIQELLVIEKNNSGQISSTVMDDVMFVPLKGKYETSD